MFPDLGQRLHREVTAITHALRHPCVRSSLTSAPVRRVALRFYRGVAPGLPEIVGHQGTVRRGGARRADSSQ